ncbi:fungal cellulose binding domain-containing protein [Astrocystis sublimbata]|nr:fungal cellulose binding domain-containing protein [Astrocystis sublimbata]
MMHRFGSLVALLLAAIFNVQLCLGQEADPTVYTDSETGITFDTWIVPDRAGGSSNLGTWGGMTVGMALPEDALTTDATEFIGYMLCPSNSTELTGWCGISLGGLMTNSLLLMAYPHEDQVLTSFRYATGYVLPDIYTGDAKLTQISSTVNSTHYSVIFRCENCLEWDHDGSTGSAPTSNGTLLLGWCNAFPAPGGAECPDTVTLEQHDNGQSIFSASLDSDAANPSYTQWASMATATVTGSCGTTTTPPTTTPTATPTGAPVPSDTYDYIVVGAGAGGIPVADKLSEAGNKVLLIEKGPPSTGQWGGTLGPDWLDGTNLTRFDVPGLCNEIWEDSEGISCTDTDVMAGCILGGGIAINAGLWWKPNGIDWDYNFPEGWKSSDMEEATSRVFSRIPGTDTPSQDGKRYLQQGFDVISGGLADAGWKSVTANEAPDEKNRTYSHTPYMFADGERGGPLTTYLVTANKRDNFDLWMNTAVKRVIRSDGHITGVEVEAFGDDGYAGTVNVTTTTGRVILSAGAFGSAKILMRSGIGPQDQLEIVKSSEDGDTMISSDSWIDLPVGYNLNDHVNTDTIVVHPDVVFYDYSEAYDNPDKTDADLYLDEKSGIFSQAAPNIGPMFFEEIEGEDGIVRQLEWTARVDAYDGSDDSETGHAMTMKQYLGRGSVSRGRMTITKGLGTVVSEAPYLQDKNDVAAVIQGIKNVQAALENVEGLKWVMPPPDTTVEDFVNNLLVSPSNRGSDHWIGTCKLGTDDGRDGGTAVVDVNTQVYGTDNLLVVDASIFPGHITSNPSSYIVIAAERAAERILALSPAN